MNICQNKIKLAVESNPNGFIFKNTIIGNEEVTLVVPSKMDTQWNNNNLILRSCIYRSVDYMPVSLGFFKFFNYGENCQLVPDPTDVDIVNSSIIEKMDGSCLCISRYNKELICRTRGTFDAENQMSNGKEISILKDKYPKAFDNQYLETRTLIFEWTTPSNIIVINYGNEPDMTLIGAIYHSDYTMVSQNELDVISENIGVKRPKRYTFSSMEDAITTIKALKGEEGVVIYYNNDQTQKKLKSEEYLALHHFKSNATWKNVMELYLEKKFRTVGEYKEYLKKTFDYECFSLVEFYIGPVMRTHMDVLGEIEAIREFVITLDKTNRKECAMSIIGEYQSPYRGIAFSLLDGKDADEKTIKEMMAQKLKVELG